MGGLHLENLFLATADNAIRAGNFRYARGDMRGFKNFKGSDASCPSIHFLFYVNSFSFADWKIMEKNTLKKLI